MATDATGTPTSPDNIPKFNTSADAPSGLGGNAQMDAIQAALSTRLSTPAGIVTGEVPVWNGSTWVRSSVLGLSPSGISGYPNDATKSLRGDGSWGKTSELLWDSVDAAVTLPAATMTTTSLPQTFKHLLIEVSARGDVVALAAALRMRVNGDSTAAWDWQQLQASATAVTASEGLTDTSAYVGDIPGASAGTFRFSTHTIRIADYAGASKRHSYTGHSSAAEGNGTNASGVTIIRQFGGTTDNSTAITTLTFLLSAGNFVAGTRISVYGEA